MSKPKKKDWIELIDEKLNELELRTEKLEKYVLQLNKFMADDMTTVGNLTLDLIAIAFGRKINLSRFDDYLELVKTKEKKLKDVKMDLYHLGSQEILRWILNISKIGKIPFEKLAPYLIGKLGKKLAKKLVRKEDILEFYGKEGLKIWETLLGK